MATIRRSGKGWQALIRKKQYQGPKAKTFSSKSQAQLWANAVEGSLKRPTQLDQPPPQILKEAIDLYIDGPLQKHRSGHNEQYPLRAMANSWMGGVLLSEMSIRHFALWRDERLLKVKPNTVMRELRILRVLLDWAKDEQGCLLKSNPARELKVRGTHDARIPHLTKQQEQDLLQQLAQAKNPNHLRLTQLALATGMRRSELLSMKWDDLDLDLRLVCLTRKDCAAQGMQRSERLVPLSPQAVELLAQYPKEQQHIIGLSSGSARHGFDRARKAAGLNQLRFHDLRHIAISKMWAEGMNALQISAISGHKDLRMLMRYSHYQLGYGGK
ncbi:tyrosine-type recombinase/integrase [Prochlorococcus marinus]|uniref:Site-specific recombinase XerD n=1 Tax=Prochlorococcus marinus (strain MIT 9211) TaxID=93059 RepID=A9BE02_PROM4|nr:site-specific integrase [Prochlorococcus marinus]ABX08312.1 Site-specific recombinase XerD [Prochlorococcus marinus str. MIT 9211]